MGTFLSHRHNYANVASSPAEMSKYRLKSMVAAVQVAAVFVVVH